MEVWEDLCAASRLAGEAAQRAGADAAICSAMKGWERFLLGASLQFVEEANALIQEREAEWAAELAAELTRLGAPLESLQAAGE